MKVKMYETQRIEREVEVRFPIYRHYGDGTDYSTWDHYERRDADGSVYEITVTEESSPSRTVYEIAHKKVNIKAMFSDMSEIDSALGKGKYSLTAEQFDKVASEALDFVRSIVTCKLR
jgi:hypothetical protein